MSNLQPFFRCTVSAAWRTGGWNSGLSHRQPEALGAKVFLQGEIVLSKKGFTMLKMTFWQHFDGMICLVYAKKQEENTGMNAPIDDTMC